MNDSRLEDYVNDKLQTFADFEALDSLIAAVETQQALLKKQLDEAERDVQIAKDASRRHDAKLEQEAQAFQRQQIDIDRRLTIVTQSDTSEDAVRRFESSMDKIHRLEVANGYLGMLSEVDQLSNEAISQLKASPEAALASYTSLRNLATSLQPLQAEAEGAAPHLLDYVEKSSLTLRKTIRDALAADLQSMLNKILWPKPQVAMPQTLQTEWERAVRRLLALQKPELEAWNQENQNKDTFQEPVVLLPLQIMVQPLEVRFQYHFSGDRTTNRLDKPEYFLSHVLDLLQSHYVFVNDYLQPILLEQFHGSMVFLDPVYLDSTAALITALLPVLRTKLFALIPQVSSQPQLLSHLIHELMSFDTTLRDEWNYTGSITSSSSTWKGLTWEVLVQHDWFGRWLQVEKNFALDRYQSIIDNNDSGSLDYDSVDRFATKPTKAAIRVNDLLETITDRYRPLSSFSQKLRFLIDIQISIFDRFHARLNSSLEAYLSMTSTVGRTVQGISASDLAGIQGVNGLDRLCRIFGSADYLEKAMRDWSDDVFFLDLWSELQSRARNHATSQRPASTAPSKKFGLFSSTFTLADVAHRTSSTLASSTHTTTDEEDATGSIFDETASAYARLRARSEAIIVERLRDGIRETMRPYAKSNPWSSLAAPETETLEPTMDLQPTLALLNESFSFLAKALALLPLRRIGRALAKVVDAYFFERVVMMHSFSTQGARQASVDVEALVGALEQGVGGDVGRIRMRRCLESMQLLGLPIRGRGRAGEEAGAEEDGEVDAAWGEAEAEAEQNVDAEVRDEEDGNGGVEEGAVALGLWQAEKRLFESNESAREVLDEMGLEVLTESEARQLLQRRVELAS